MLPLGTVTGAAASSPSEDSTEGGRVGGGWNRGREGGFQGKEISEGLVRVWEGTNGPFSRGVLQFALHQSWVRWGCQF